MKLSHKALLVIIAASVLVSACNYVFGCPYSTATICNQTNSSKYVIVYFGKAHHSVLKKNIFVTLSNAGEVILQHADTLTNVGLYSIQPHGSMVVYGGPASPPELLFEKLQIVSSKEIIEFDNEHDLLAASSKTKNDYTFVIE